MAERDLKSKSISPAIYTKARPKERKDDQDFSHPFTDKEKLYVLFKATDIIHNILRATALEE